MDIRLSNFFIILLLISPCLLLSGCGQLSDISSMPDKYLKQILADAAECPLKDLEIINQRYKYPSDIWTVSCRDKTYQCREQRYGYDLFSGNMFSEMVCIPEGSQ